MGWEGLWPFCVVGIYNNLIYCKICPGRPRRFRRRKKKKNHKFQPKRKRNRITPTIGISSPMASKTDSTTLSPLTLKLPTSSPKFRAAIRATRLMREKNVWQLKLRKRPPPSSRINSAHSRTGSEINRKLWRRISARSRRLTRTVEKLFCKQVSSTKQRSRINSPTFRKRLKKRKKATTSTTHTSPGLKKSTVESDSSHPIFKILLTSPFKRTSHSLNKIIHQPQFYITHPQTHLFPLRSQTLCLESYLLVERDIRAAGRF